MTGDEQYRELRIPRPGGEIVSTIGCLVLFVTVFAASYNLLHPECVPTSGIIASLMWLGLVVFAFSVSLRNTDRVKRCFINLFGRYARCHYVRAAPSTGIANNIFIGYSFLGSNWNYLSLNTSAILSVDWKSGQATHMAGRDMDDWHVAIWYHHPKGPQRKRWPGVRDEEIFIIGPTGSKESIEKLGRELIRFLESVGVEFTAGKDDREFNTPTRHMLLSVTNQGKP